MIDRPHIPAPSIAARFLYTWDSQVVQYPKHGEQGIDHVVGNFVAPGSPQPLTVDGVRQLYTETEDPGYIGQRVLTLLYRNRKGRIVGILNYYPQDGPDEKQGNVNLWVKPECQGGGIGTKLVNELARRGWPTTWEQQSYSMAGHSFATRYLEGRGAP